MNGTLNKFENILDKLAKSQTMVTNLLGHFYRVIDSSTIVFFASKVSQILKPFV